MLNKKQLIFCLISLATITVATAQNATDSPYSLYGYGRLANSSFGAAGAMGGASIGARQNDRINPANPASYSAIDSTTFLLDFGVSGQIEYLSEGSTKETKQNGNIEYIAIQFPISKGMGASVGILPYSHVGYQFGSTQTNDLGETKAYKGEGGFSQAYIGLSGTPFKNLSIGANFNYLFGSITHNSTVSSNISTASGIISTLSVRALKTDLGIQWFKSIDKERNFSLGLTYSPKIKLNAKVDSINFGTVNDTTSNRNIKCELAETYGIGANWKINNQWTVATDALYQKWSDALYMSKKGTMKDRVKISSGFEFTPNSVSRHYYDRIKYRFGANFSNNYFDVKNQKINEAGISMGIGLPFKSSKSILNITVDYSRITPQYSNLVKENYLKLTLNLTINEYWFFKRKLD